MTDLLLVSSNSRIGTTKLHFASWLGNLEWAVSLIEDDYDSEGNVKRGLDVNTTDDKHQTPLHDAAKSGSIPMMKMLFDRGASLGDTPVFRNFFVFKQKWVPSGFNSNGEAESLCRMNYCKTPLHMAAKHGKMVNISVVLLMDFSWNGEPKWMENLEPSTTIQRNPISLGTCCTRLCAIWRPPTETCRWWRCCWSMGLVQHISREKGFLCLGVDCPRFSVRFGSIRENF